ncbi:MAG: T9SS type A sorting domain-containing protein [Bacteroidia bacterium]|nr:T9SS type A sorting domain-containing protein [Bacteroidia bacterium]
MPKFLFLFLFSVYSITAQSLSISVPPYASAISTSGLTINWETDIFSSGHIVYGKTISLELGTLSSTGNGTMHSVSITGTNSAEVYYAKIFSVAGADTASTSIRTFITASLSSGTITCYFNSSVDTSVSVSPANYSTRLAGLFDDTLAAYIDRAQSTLDITIYNFGNTNTAAVISAINNAFNRGVRIRLIADGGNTNSALPALNSAIPKLLSPTGVGYGIMHNKFMIIDPFTSNPSDAVLWTGSTNWTDAQLNTDANNIIIFRDQSIARAYLLEFNEMWGDTGMAPNLANSRFGPFKTDNTPHQFVIGGKNVECYFSPSDGVTSKITNTINSADDQLCFSLLSYTRTDLASAVAARANAGVSSYGMIEDTGSGGGSAFLIMQAAMNNRLRIDALPRLLHHKYLIVDQNNSSSAPQVLTGSHNWSNSAETRNDENIVIVHDQSIANQYYQEFVKRFYENGGVIGINENNSDDNLFMVYPNPASSEFRIQESGIRIRGIEIFDVLGQSVLQPQTSNFKAGSAIDVSQLSPGIYLMRADFGKTATVRFIVR